MRKLLFATAFICIAFYGYTQNASCDKIEKKVDEFTGDIRLYSPLSKGFKMNPMIIYKSIIKDDTIYYLSLRTPGLTLNVGETGTIILFEDGSKITSSDKIDVKVNSGGDGYIYNVFFLLSKEDMQILRTKKIKKFRLYIYDEEVKEDFASTFNEYVNCIIDKK